MDTRKHRLAAFILGFSLLAPLPTLANDLQHQMQKAGNALGELIPYLYNDEQFRAPGNRDVILQQLNQLVSSMEATPGLMSDHAKVRLISQASVIHQLTQARLLFQQGDHATAQYLLAGTPVLCSSCHIQDGVSARHAPALRREHFANEFSYAELNYYLRDYPTALASYERYLQTPEVAASWIRGGKTLERLLDISLMTEKDRAKTRERLQRYQRAPGLDDALKKQISEWLAGLETLANRDVSPATIESQLLQEFGALIDPKPETRLPETKRPLALIWRASLQQHSNAVTTREETARDLYLLAILDRLLGEQTELSLSRLYLKECVALNVPTHSEKCMSEFEKRQQFFYGVDSPAALPEEAASEIAAMKALLKKQPQ